MGAERRRFERWKFEEGVYCYIEGTRFDARSADVSSGGMFFETARPILPGTEVAMVFRTQLDKGDRPIFLVGRVMRRQVKPVAGVGVRWERASTPATPEALTAFLKGVLRVEPRGIEVKPFGASGIVQAVFEFPLDPEQLQGARVSDVEEESAPVAGGATFEHTEELEDTMPEEVISAKTDKVPPRIAGAGPLTMQISTGGTNAPANIQARIEVRKKWLTVKISALGSQHMFVESRGEELEPGLEAQVRFDLPVKGGETQVACRCRIVSRGKDFRSAQNGVLLEIIRVEEGKFPGILNNYVRWLHFHALRKA
jgi:hypothetical protein